MAGLARFNNLGGMSSGPADLFGLITNLRLTESSKTVRALNNQCDRYAVENCTWLVQVLCRY